ncbi:hypothetical protein DTO027I6_9775 [Penicillium roqueforti]|nr:hypothetical protein CBS147337_9828 [Penicillium roqueforti]KAI3185346.1 hypothetical protein DTO027I6_9775 [Penicillium roqueforti]KAJ5046957.1 hypothetical protein NUH16_011120 [Penicillium rubens]
MSLCCPPLRDTKKKQTYLGDLAVSSRLEGASKPRTRRSQVCISSSSTVGLYRRLWGSCVSRHVDGQKLQQSNQTLKEAGASLRKERDGLQLYDEKQLAPLRFFELALKSSRERLTRVLDGWNHPSRLNLTETPDIAKQG